MTATSEVVLDRAGRPGGRYGWGWVQVAVAGVAMVATLPGRTQGLGLITEQLRQSFDITAVQYANLNLVATLIGATFCLFLGPLVDRWGSRVMLALILAALGATVVGMRFATMRWELLLALVLTRGFGQSALSVVSLTIVGKWFVRKLPLAMAVFSIIVGLGFVAAFVGVGGAANFAGWRATWGWMGVTLLAVVLPVGILLVRRTPESVGLKVDGGAGEVIAEDAGKEEGATLREALMTPAFWVFALASAAFGLVSSGLMLFNQAVLSEHGMDPNGVQAVLGVITFVALVFNFVGGFLAEKWRINWLMGLAMFLLAGSLFALPAARGAGLVYAYAVAMGAAAGIVTVVFFVCWGKMFGRRRLGAIQGAAQLMTVVASAEGPRLLADSMERTGSSAGMLMALGGVVAVLGVACCGVRVGKPEVRS